MKAILGIGLLISISNAIGATSRTVAPPKVEKKNPYRVIDQKDRVLVRDPMRVGQNTIMAVTQMGPAQKALQSQLLQNTIPFRDAKHSQCNDVSSPPLENSMIEMEYSFWIEAPLEAVLSVDQVSGPNVSYLSGSKLVEVSREDPALITVSKKVLIYTIKGQVRAENLSEQSFKLSDLNWIDLSFATSTGKSQDLAIGDYRIHRFLNFSHVFVHGLNVCAYYGGTPSYAQDPSDQGTFVVCRQWTEIKGCTLKGALGGLVRSQIVNRKKEELSALVERLRELAQNRVPMQKLMP